MNKIHRVIFQNDEKYKEHPIEVKKMMDLTQEMDLGENWMIGELMN